MFEKAGFVNIRIEASSGFFTTWIVKMNYFSMRFIRGPGLLRFLIKLLLIPFWAIGQTLAPLLDKLDLYWEAESQGYFVLAMKK